MAITTDSFMTDSTTDSIMAKAIAGLLQQVKCPVCLDVFTTPKALACTHAFCMDCINHLPVDIVDGSHTIYCPACREPTKLPHNGSAASLRPAHFVNTLMELYQSAVKVTSERSKDNVCLKHDRPLEMFCDDCRQVVCAKCDRLDHRDHNCDYVTDFFNKHRQEIDSYLKPVTQQLNIVLDALHNLDTLQEHITAQGESVKNQIDTLVAQLVQAIQQSGARLKQDVDTLVQHKVTEMLRYKEEGEKLVAEVKSYKQHVQDKLCNGTQQEILLEKNDMIERLTAVNQELQVQEIQLKEIGDIAFIQSNDVLEKCGRIGKVSGVPVAKSLDSFRCPLVKFGGIKVAIVGRPRTIDISVPNVGWLKRGSLSCHLVANIGGVLTPCEIKRSGKGTYRISFTATCIGLYYIKVQAKGRGISCSPCIVQVVPTIKKVDGPSAIAATTDGLLLVAECSSIAVMDRGRQMVRRFASQGGGMPEGVCATPDRHILVVSEDTPHITKYSMTGALVAKANTGKGSGPLQFRQPQGIAVSSSGHVYVCDTGNHRLQVLNPNLMFFHTIGEYGSGPGQFHSPCGVAVDSQGMLYVCDHGNNRIQKLSSTGAFISEFAVQKKSPVRYIAIDCNVLYLTTHHEVLVYTTDGEMINVIEGAPGAYGRWSYQGIAADDGHVYVCDGENYEIVTF